MGTKELKEALDFVLELVAAIDAAKEDGFSIGDLPTFIPVASKAPAAFAGIDQLPSEIKDLDDAEAEELVEFFSAKLNLDSEKTEKAIEDAFAILIQIIRAVNNFKNE